MSKPAHILLLLIALLRATSSNALSFPLFPGTPESLCSLTDMPWYLCNSSENISPEAVPQFYNRIVSFFGGDDEGEDSDGGARRNLRRNED